MEQHNVREMRIQERLNIEEEMDDLEYICGACGYLALALDSSEIRPTQSEMCNVLKVVEIALGRVRDGIEAKV